MWTQARVVEAEEGFVLTLTTVYLDQPDTRELIAGRCEALADATALVVAYAIDPSLEDGSNETVAVPEPDRQPATPQSLGSTSPPVETSLPDAVLSIEHHPELPPRTAARSHAIVVRVAPLFAAGGMPGVGAGATVAVGLQRDRLQAEVYGLYLAPRRDDAPFSVAGLYQLGAVGGRACMRWGTGIVRAPTCVGLEGGSLRVDSRQLDPNRTLSFPWLTPTLGAGLGTEGRRVRLWSLAELAVPAFRSRVFVGEETAWHAFPVAFRLQLGVELFFSIESR